MENQEIISENSQRERDWTDIHEDFEDIHSYYNNQELWEKHGFNYQTAKEWAEVLEKNFEVSDFAFCAWLRDERHLIPQKIQQQKKVESLKKEYQELWTDHGNFADKYEESKTYQQRWEENNLTCQDAQEWIPAGFEPKDYDSVRHGKNTTSLLKKLRLEEILVYNLLNLIMIISIMLNLLLI